MSQVKCDHWAKCSQGKRILCAELCFSDKFKDCPERKAEEQATVWNKANPR